MKSGGRKSGGFGGERKVVSVVMVREAEIDCAGSLEDSMKQKLLSGWTLKGGLEAGGVESTRKCGGEGRATSYVDVKQQDLGMPFRMGEKRLQMLNVGKRFYGKAFT